MEGKNILEQIRCDVERVCDLADHVKINESKLEEFVRQLTPEELTRWNWTVAQDTGSVQFDGPTQPGEEHEVMTLPLRRELNVIAVIDLLNFASGFRHPLHKQTGRGAYQTIRTGVLALFQTSPLHLMAAHWAELTLDQVLKAFELHQADQETPSALLQLGNMLRDVLQQTGAILTTLGKQDLAEYIWDVCEGRATAAQLTRSLVNDFPAFADIHAYQGETIHIVKKAQLLCADVYRHFHAQVPDRFDFADVQQLTVMSDNVLPAVLRGFGILEYDATLSEQIDQGHELPAGAAEVELRAMAVAASERIVQKYRQIHSERGDEFTPMVLDFYLWSKGKDPAFRSLERHSTTDTIFY